MLTLVALAVTATAFDATADGRRVKANKARRHNLAQRVSELERRLDKCCPHEEGDLGTGPGISEPIISPETLSSINSPRLTSQRRTSPTPLQGRRKNR